MASRFYSKPPVWFWVVAVVLLVWEGMGIWSWWEQYQHGAAGMGHVPTDYEVQYFAKLPAWHIWLFAAAVWSGLIGAVLLLMRKAAARSVYVISTVLTLLMFGYTFLLTDILQVKGAATAYFPVFIIVMRFVAIWFAGTAMKRGWLS